MMIEYLNDIDTQALLFLNNLHSSFFDEFFMSVTGKCAWLGKFAWAPMILVLLYCIFRTDWKTGLTVLLGIGLTILLCDQISSGLIKEAVCRLRPAREPAIEGLVHTVDGYRSGGYSFVSSHAANSFGLATFLLLVLRHRAFTWAVLLWAALFSYSRIYLGVHYPGDIVCGALLGAAIGALVYWLYEKARRVKALHGKPGKGNEGRIMAWAIAGNTTLVLIIATIIFATN